MKLRGRQQRAASWCELGPDLDKLRPDINFGQFQRTFPFEIFGRDPGTAKAGMPLHAHGTGLAQRRAFAMPMNAAEEYRLVAWDCLKMAEVTSDPETLDSLLNLAQHWARMAEQAERSHRHWGV